MAQPRVNSLTHDSHVKTLCYFAVYLNLFRQTTTLEDTQKMMGQEDNPFLFDAGPCSGGICSFFGEVLL